MFSITFETTNAAFGDHPHEEIARILRETADRIEAGKYTPRVRDVNGNTIGSVEFVGEWRKASTPR